MAITRRQFVLRTMVAAAALGGRGRLVWAEDEAAAAEILPAQVVVCWGTNGHGPGEFDIPIGIALDNENRVLVSDFRQTNAEAPGRLQRFDIEGNLLAGFEVDPMPGGLAVDAEGLIFASHMMRHKIAVYDSSGKRVREFGKQGTGPGEFDQPGGIAFGPDGSLFVADQVNRRVQRLSPKGEPIAAWGKYGVAPGEFGGNSSPKSRVGGPQFLAFDRTGHLYTTEASLGRVQKFTAEGAFVLAWGDNEEGPGHFGGYRALPGPIAVAVDLQGRVWITSTNHRVQQFGPDGTFLKALGGEGKEPGKFHLPHGLTFDREGFLYVADSRNSRIQKLAID